MEPPQGDQASRDACKNGTFSNPTLRSRRPPGSDRCAPHTPPAFVAAWRRDRPRVSLSRRAHPPVVALCDISGWIKRIYPPLFALPACLGREPARVDVSVWHPPDQREPRDARPRSRRRARRVARPWRSTGPAAPELARRWRAWTRDWSRRVLGQGAITLLITDGLERDNLDTLGRDGASRQIEPAHNLGQPAAALWRFCCQGGGIRTMLPYVNSFLPIHNLASMGRLLPGIVGRSKLVRLSEGAAPRRQLISRYSLADDRGGAIE